MSRMNSPSAETYPAVGDLVAVEWHGGRNVLADGPAPVSPTWTATGYVIESPTSGSNYVSMKPTGSGFPVAHGRAGVRALNGAVGVLDNEDFSLTRENLTVRRTPLDIYFVWRLITPAPVVEMVEVTLIEGDARNETIFSVGQHSSGWTIEVPAETVQRWTRNERAFNEDNEERGALLAAHFDALEADRKKGGK